MNKKNQARAFERRRQRRKERHRMRRMDSSYRRRTGWRHSRNPAKHIEMPRLTVDQFAARQRQLQQERVRGARATILTLLIGASEGTS